jgi:N-acetylmuramoyl-L-alanine amidase
MVVLGGSGMSLVLNVLKGLFVRFGRRGSSSRSIWTNTFPNAPTDAVDVLAMTIWGEARGESQDGRRAVAGVILNRANWQGPTARFMRGADPQNLSTPDGRIMAVCLAKSQFSCWWNRVYRQERPYPCNQWTDCCMIAKAVVGGGWKPPVSSLYYHADYVHPSWAEGMEIECKIGRHIFYKG